MCLLSSNEHDNLMKKKAKKFRKSKFLTDVELIGHNGSVSLHKIILLQRLPILAQLLCEYCDHHANTTFILPDHTKEEIENEVKKLYTFGMVAGVEEMFGFKTNIDVSGIGILPAEKDEYNDILNHKVDAANDESEEDPRPFSRDNLEDQRSEADNPICRVDITEENEVKENFLVKSSLKLEPDEEEIFVNLEEKMEVIKISCFAFFNQNCHLCNLQLSSESELSEHFYQTHEPLSVESNDGKPVYQCRPCSKQFKQYPAAVNHCRVRKPYQCPDCSKTISSRNNIGRHNKRCTGGKSFFCLKCQRIIKCTTFETHSTKCKVRRDPGVKQEVQNYITCTLCDFKAIKSSSIKKHMTIGHSENVREFKCDKCDREFHSRSGLSRHVADHHSQMTFTGMVK